MTVALSSLTSTHGTLSANAGGTGVANNAASTITITGSFGTTFTVTGTTGVTLPTAGTLAALGGTNTWTGVNTHSANVLFSADDTYNIGAPGATRPANVYVANAIVATGEGKFGAGLYIGTAGSNQSNFYPIGDGIIRLVGESGGAYNDFNRLQFGGTTVAYPSLKRFGSALALRTGNDAVSTFSNLTAASAAGEGALAVVTDSSTATWGATITGSGANRVLAYCNGTNWTVAAV